MARGASKMNGPTLKSWLVRATLVASIASVAACGASGISPSAATRSPSESASAETTSSGAVASQAPTAEPTPGTIALKAYFLLYGSSDESPGALVPVNREVEATVAVARAAMEQLLAGPTEDERAHDVRVGTIGTQIPEGTTLLGIDVENGVATVDLSGAFASGDILGDDIESWAIRLAQVTYTMTQFPTVESVRFIVDGKPAAAIEGHEGTPIDLATRDAYADQRPGVFVDEPAWGGALTDPVTVFGLAQIAAEAPEFEPPEFHAALVSRTTDEIVVQQTVRATCPTGCWEPPGGGPFQFEIAVPDGADRDDLMLRVWEIAADGSEVGMLQYPLH
jgi:spore germination protein GerM